MKLQKPFDKFRLEKSAGEYKDFHVAEDDPYPLKGVTYPVDYGDIPGYTGEDGHNLDVFVGNGEVYGYIQVSRPDVEGGIEHKVYIGLTEDEESEVLEAFEPVLLGHNRFNSYDGLVTFVEQYRD